MIICQKIDDRSSLKVLKRGSLTYAPFVIWSLNFPHVKVMPVLYSANGQADTMGKAVTAYFLGFLRCSWLSSTMKP